MTGPRVVRRAAPWLALVLFSLAANAAPPEVAWVEITVADLDRSVAFFVEVLNFDVVGEREASGDAREHLQGVFGLVSRSADLRLGRERIVLTEYLTPRGRAVPADSRSNDHWFQHVAIVTRDMDRAYARLREHRVRHVSSGPQRLPDWNPAAGGIRAFYFQDPDGHNLEVIWYPPGKGDPRWQEPGTGLFLGIDHTAIVVTDTEQSLRFWRDALGLLVVGESENWGPEQERLNQVFGARLRITGLRGASGPGVEFLEYLAPTTGRSTPADVASNDLVHWQTAIRGLPSGTGEASLVRAGGRAVSPGPVELPQGSEASAAALLRDPDGHAVLLLH